MDVWVKVIDPRRFLFSVPDPLPTRVGVKRRKGRKMYGNHQAGRIGRRLASVFLLLCAAILALVVLSAPSEAVVRNGKTLTVGHDIDFVSAGGYAENSPVTVALFRNGVQIGDAGGPAAIDIPQEGFGLEVNHGPLVDPPNPGDCWNDLTPDVLPGDEVRVTGDGGTDTMIVADVRFTGGPVEQAGGNITLDGVGLQPDGVTPILVNTLAGEMRDLGPRIRLEPDDVVPLAGVAGGWRAVYSPPFSDNVVQEDPGVTEAQRRTALLRGAHSMTYAGIANEVTIADFPAANGPAAGCEGSPASANAVTTFDDEFINRTSGSLVIGGVAMAGTTDTSVTLSDTSPATPDITTPAALSGGAGPQTWTVTIPRTDPNGPDIDELADGRITVSGTYAPVNGGQTKQIRKDTAAPVLSANPASGTYIGARGVALRSDGDGAIRYTTDGQLPNNNSRLYDGTRIPLGLGTHKIRAFTVDAANNRTDATFNYRINDRAVSSVSLNAAGTDLTLGRSRLVSGRLTPAHPGRPVKVIIRRNGQQVAVRNVASVFSFRYRPNATGLYSLTASFAGDADTRPDSSPVRRFRVVR